MQKTTPQLMAELVGLIADGTIPTAQVRTFIKKSCDPRARRKRLARKCLKKARTLAATKGSSDAHLAIATITKEEADFAAARNDRWCTDPADVWYWNVRARAYAAVAAITKKEEDLTAALDAARNTSSHYINARLRSEAFAAVAKAFAQTGNLAAARNAAREVSDHDHSFTAHLAITEASKDEADIAVARDLANRQLDWSSRGHAHLAIAATTKEEADFAAVLDAIGRVRDKRRLALLCAKAVDQLVQVGNFTAALTAAAKIDYYCYESVRAYTVIAKALVETGDLVAARNFAASIGNNPRGSISAYLTIAAVSKDGADFAAAREDAWMVECNEDRNLWVVKAIAAALVQAGKIDIARDFAESMAWCKDKERQSIYLTIAAITKKEEDLAAVPEDARMNSTYLTILGALAQAGDLVTHSGPASVCYSKNPKVYAAILENHVQAGHSAAARDLAKSVLDPEGRISAYLTIAAVSKDEADFAAACDAATKVKDVIGRCKAYATIAKALLDA